MIKGYNHGTRHSGMLLLYSKVIVDNNNVLYISFVFSPPYLFFAVLRVKPRALPMLGKKSVTELYPKACIFESFQNKKMINACADRRNQHDLHMY